MWVCACARVVAGIRARVAEMGGEVARRAAAGESAWSGERARLAGKIAALEDERDAARGERAFLAQEREEIAGELRALGVRAAFLNSTLSLDGVREVESALLSGELDLLYVAPERLLLPRTLDLLDRAPVALFAVD